MTTDSLSRSKNAATRKVVSIKERTRSGKREGVIEGRSNTSRFDVALLVLLVLCGALLRLDFMRAVEYTIDSDEAIVGLMAKHILEGAALPTFYYGQHYMGSLEAIMASASFWLFGMSGFTLQLVPLVWSLVLIVVMFFLGRECGGVVVGRIAALLTAIPPVALVVWSTKARGGFIEIVVLGALAMYGAARWFKRSPRATSYPIFIGFILGVGWWVNNQILYFMVPIAVMAALYVVREWRPTLHSSLDVLRVIVCGSLAFFVGSSPYWLYNIERGFPSLGMFGRSSVKEIGEHLVGVWETAIPILLGAKHFWEADSIFPGSTEVYYLAYGLLFAVVAWARRGEIAKLLKGSIDSSAPVEMIFLFLVVAVSIFVISTFGWLYKAPRYLLPTYVGLFVVCSYGCMLLLERWKLLGAVAIACLVGLNVSSSYAGGRAIPGEPVVFAGERVSRDHSDIIATLERLGITKIKTNYWIGYRLAFETNEGVTFLVSGEPRQVRIESYESGLSDAERDHMPLLLVGSEAASIRPALARLGYSYEELQASRYTLFYDLIKNTEDLAPLGPTDIAEIRAQGPQEAQGAVDGSSHTRWGSGEPQHPGMVFEVLFKENQRLRAIEYDLGEWIHDYPRGLEVDLLLPNGSVKPVLSEAEFEGIRIFLQDNRSVPIVFPSQEVRGVRLIQTGRHPVVDWSIAELRFFSQR
jgi:hypothetical protein